MVESFLHKSIAISLAILLSSPLTAAAQQASPDPQLQNEARTPAASQDAPSPAQQNAPALESRPPSESRPDTAQEPNRPVGTATAPYEKASGVTASRPAGAVIAPAKQRRVRTIFIRIGIVVGAAAAVGAVAALSHGSPSQPH
jgi:hypothetical protein